MQINDIKLFYEVSNLKSTIKAANKLGYVQSNVSKRIKKLEDELGRKLFHRTTKGMTLTADGEIFLFYAESILTTFSDMEDAFLIRKNQVRIGATQTISKNYLQNDYFKENLAIFTNSSSGLIQQLREGMIDFMIVNKKISLLEFKEIKTMEEKIFWTKAQGTNDKLFGYTIIVSRDTDCPYRIATLDYVKKNNMDGRLIVEVDTLDVLTSMVESNKAVAILPERTIDLNDKLQSLAYPTCPNVMIHVYARQNNTIPFMDDLLTD